MPVARLIMARTSKATAAASTAASRPNIPAAVSIDDLIEKLAEEPEAAASAGLQVKGPPNGRRRAGRAFGPEAVIIPLVALTEDQLRAIDADPLLSWALAPLPEEDAEKAGDDDAGNN